MAINFNDRVLVVNPTTFFIGKCILAGGTLAVATGVITHYTGYFIFPPKLWAAFGIPTIPSALAMMWSALRKN